MKQKTIYSAALAIMMASFGSMAGTVNLESLSNSELHKLADTSPELTQEIELTLINRTQSKNPALDADYWSQSSTYEGAVVFKRNALIDTDMINLHGTGKGNKPYVNRHALRSGLAPAGPDSKPVQVCRFIKVKSASYYEMAYTDVEPMLSATGSKMSREEACLTPNLAKAYWTYRYHDLIDEQGDYIK